MLSRGQHGSVEVLSRGLTYVFQEDTSGAERMRGGGEVGTETCGHMETLRSDPGVSDLSIIAIRG